MDTLACFALTRDMPIDELLNYKPCGRYKPLISRTLLRNVIGHSIYQLIVMSVLIFKGGDLFDIIDGFQSDTFCLPTQHTSIVFTTFVSMQLFNEINARMLQERNVFNGIYENFCFLIIWFGQAVLQVCNSLFSFCVEFLCLCSFCSSAMCISCEQRVKKVVSNSWGLVDFAIRQVNSVLNLPNQQVKCF